MCISSNNHEASRGALAVDCSLSSHFWMARWPGRAVTLELVEEVFPTEEEVRFLSLVLSMDPNESELFVFPSFLAEFPRRPEQDTTDTLPPRTEKIEPILAEDFGGDEAIALMAMLVASVETDLRA
mmetsp:Transcript_77527/g.161121  ORF Transcript_77527/g.161121 Transcript_77527/m.161121 type:complete len:126 (+) Transcript_77527:584-961(+)